MLATNPSKNSEPLISNTNFPLKIVTNWVEEIDAIDPIQNIL